MPHLTRRASLVLLSLAVLPTALRAETCAELLPGLRLCDARGWVRGDLSDGMATLTHATGLTATISFQTGLDAEGETWANWQQSHAPISARAEILTTDLGQIDGRYASFAAWRPRHMPAPTIVAMTGYVGDGMALAVTTVAAAATFDDTHRDAHQRLCAALRLDLPE